MASAAELLSKRNMKILNFLAIAIVIIAWLIRFYYFTKREELHENADGTVTQTEVQDSLMLIVYTLMVFPMLIAIFIITELQLKPKIMNLCKHFYFLDYYLGKGLYLLLLASLILQHQDMIQWLFVVAILVVTVVDLIHGCIMGAEPINPPPEWDSAKEAPKSTTASEKTETATKTQSKFAAGKSAAMKTSISQLTISQQQSLKSTPQALHSKRR